jgi:hypothetical protein
MDLKPPIINTKTESAQKQELTNYLFQLVQDLNFMFNNIDIRLSEVERKIDKGGK